MKVSMAPSCEGYIPRDMRSRMAWPPTRPEAPGATTDSRAANRPDVLRPLRSLTTRTPKEIGQSTKVDLAV